MAVTQDGGHLHTSTVENIGPQPSEALTRTGGELAKSDPARLQAAYPSSPIWSTDPGLGGYTAAAVAGLKGNLVRNTVKPGDIADAQSYYGFPATVSEDENTPSTGDLSYNGAPNVTAVTEDKNGNPIASPYMPNLLPPNSFNPTADNPTPVVLTPEQSHSATTPFHGDGLMSPHGGSAKVQESLKPEEGAGSDAGANPPPVDGGSGGGA